MQALAAISVAALVRLMDIGGHALSESDWGRLLHTIRDMSDATRPVELLQPESLGNFGTPLPSGGLYTIPTLGSLLPTFTSILDSQIGTLRI
jgi:hypothetical protein